MTRASTTGGASDAAAVTVPATPPVLAFRPDLEPLVRVRAGARVSFATVDACAGTVTSEEHVVSLDGIGDPAVVTGGNPASGPVAVDDAQPGDTLIVDVRSIDLAARGFVCAVPEVGPLAARIPVARTWFLEIGDGVARRGDLTVPLRPMIGVIGVATERDVVATDFPGPHGGNLDNRMIRPGSRVYLPVRQVGAMLALGDVHAAMGDGELVGAGLETDATVVVDVDLLKGRQAEWPIVETEDAWYVHGAGRTWDEAVAVASEQAALQLEREWSVPRDEIPLYLSLASDLGVCQACRPGPFPVVVRLGLRRSPTAPSPFRRVAR